MGRSGALSLIFVSCLLVAGLSRAEMLRPGDDFPEWRLPDQTGTLMSASELAGRSYLMWFYPRAMMPGCTLEGQVLRDHTEDLKHLQVLILGVSFDDPATNARFARRESFPFPLLSDRDGRLAIAVGAARRGDATAARVSYLVGPSGKVLKVYDTVNPGAHAVQVLRDLRDLSPE